MGVGRFVGSIAVVRRKLQALNAETGDTGATGHERTTAAALKTRLEQRLKEAAELTRDWTNSFFRLGRQVKELQRTTSPNTLSGDWADNAFRHCARA